MSSTCDVKTTPPYAFWYMSAQDFIENKSTLPVDVITVYSDIKIGGETAGIIDHFTDHGVVGFSEHWITQRQVVQHRKNILPFSAISLGEFYNSGDLLVAFSSEHSEIHGFSFNQNSFTSNFSTGGLGDPIPLPYT